MDLPGILTRAQFNQACKAFIRKNTLLPVDDLLSRNLDGWQWNEHSVVPGLGYMSRVGSVLRKSLMCDQSGMLDDEMAEELVEDDTSTLPANAPTHVLLTVQQYIVYSPTFQVPAFYFTAHDSNGSSLDLQGIMQSNIFHAHSLPKDVETNPHGISLPTSNFPLLSQGDHPVLGTPCWYFHPCETSTAITEILQETGFKDHQTEDDKLLQWMEVWFMVLCSVVDVR